MSDKLNKPRVYVIVRRDLDEQDIPVQVAHAALESGIHRTHIKDYPASIVVLAVRNEKRLIKARDYIEGWGVKCELFWERPMISYTALATEVVDKSNQHIFKKYQLLKMGQESWWKRLRSWFKKFR